ncbi:MAG: DUF1571 domain-containing protein [Planctomycetes bacterium]|nr:DUF1571 domain-containing protein [Planctomycetota bacterium]
MFRAGAMLCLVLFTAGVSAEEPAEPHPLTPLLEFAKERLKVVEEGIDDYTCTLVRRERIDGHLTSQSFALVKLRHQKVRDREVVVPFSVYMRFRGPAEVEGREVLYVQGQNDGKMVVRRGGRRFRFITVSIDPLGDLAASDSRYPITAMGIKSLIERLIEVGEEELKHDEIEVKYFPGAKVNGRACTAVKVTHAVRRDHFRYHIAEVFIDEALQLPIRFASYDWPEEEGGKPQLLEEYTFLDLKLNAGLTGGDFDRRNQSYGFERGFVP